MRMSVLNTPCRIAFTCRFFFSSCKHFLITRLIKTKTKKKPYVKVTYVVVSMYLAPAEMNMANVTAQQ